MIVKTHLCCLQHLLCFLLRVTDKDISNLIGDQHSVFLQHHEVVTGILQVLQRFLQRDNHRLLRIGACE